MLHHVLHWLKNFIMQPFKFLVWLVCLVPFKHFNLQATGNWRSISELLTIKWIIWGFHGRDSSEKWLKWTIRARFLRIYPNIQCSYYMVGNILCEFLDYTIRSLYGLLFFLIKIEPIGSVAPKVNSYSKFDEMSTRQGEILSLLCIAQAYPTGSFR